jgi:hydroxypyruvate reductase
MQAQLLLQAIKNSLQQFTLYPALVKRLNLLDTAKPLHILAIGKAAWQMAYVANQALRHHQLASCTVLTKYGFYPGPSSKAAGCRFHWIRQVSCQEDQSESSLGFDTSPCRNGTKFRQKESSYAAYADETSAILLGEAGNPDIRILEAGHPVPDENSIRHTQAILDYLQKLPADHELIILLSGGSSALFELPEDGHTLEDIISLNRLLLGSGLDIRQINLKRRELSQVKSGKAISYINCRIRGVYLLSDVEGNDPAIIGSGPFYSTGARRSAESVKRQSENTSSVEMSMVETSSVETSSRRLIINSFGKMPNPQSCDRMSHPQQDSTRPRVETERSSVKESDLVAYADEDVCNPIPHLLIGANQAFLKVLRRSLQQSCPWLWRLSSRFINQDIGYFAKALRTICPSQTRIYLFGGELTFKPSGNGKADVAVICITDGKEISAMPGTTFSPMPPIGNDNIRESAGAIVDEHSWQQMITAGCDPEQAIRTSDSYSALKAIDAIIPGCYTGTNVNEVYGLLRNEMGHYVTK